jgi:hypothetical protein
LCPLIGGERLLERPAVAAGLRESAPFTAPNDTTLVWTMKVANTAPLRPGTIDRQEIVEKQNGTDSQVPPISREVFENLPLDVKPLLCYLVAGD